MNVGGIESINSFIKATSQAGVNLGQSYIVNKTSNSFGREGIKGGEIYSTLSTNE